MTSFAPSHRRRIAEQARMLLHHAELNADRRAHGAPALAGIERRDQLVIGSSALAL